LEKNVVGRKEKGRRRNKLALHVRSSTRKEGRDGNPTREKVRNKLTLWEIPPESEKGPQSTR